jgi:hypothetical protein
MYCAYITTIKNLRKHTNADRLQCVEVFGQNVIVDLNYYEGQKVVFFPSDGQLSLEYATDNNLVRVKDENGNNIGGYMDPEKRNVTAIRLRGEKSEGLVLPIETLSKYTDVSKLKDGDQITVLDGHEICQKYIPRGKRNNHPVETGSKKEKKKSKESVSYPFFEEHKDTAQLAYNMSAFRPGDTIYVTRKLHGTSARTMKTVKITKKSNKLRRFLHMEPKITREVSVVSGSRRVVLKDMNANDGYYSDNGFRKKCHDLLKDNLPEGFEVFYEIVGYVNETTPIMGSVSNKGVKEKEFVKKFGDTTTFSYGCKPGESDMYVYRMTATTADGTVVELPWETVKVWCDKLGVKHVPDLEKFIYTTPEDLKERVNKYLSNMPADEIGKTHVAEGVVVRIDNRSTFTAYKDKVFEFKVIEGIAKDTSDVPDMEEAEELFEETLNE